MERSDRDARRADTLAAASLLRFLGGMLLMAGLAGLLLGAYSFDKDRQARQAMGQAMATVTKPYVHGGAYFVVYEADGATHEALMGYENGTLEAGDQVMIRFDPTEYRDVRVDAPASVPLYLLSIGILVALLGALALFGQFYLKGREENPWRSEYGA